VNPTIDLAPRAIGTRPRLGEGVRLQADRFAGAGKVLLFPEGVHLLDETKQAILELRDGRRDIGEIVAVLSEQSGQSPEVIRPDLAEFLLDLNRDVLVGFEGEGASSVARLVRPRGRDAARSRGGEPRGGIARPLGLLAELTHRCPLRCPYCSNPTSYPPAGGELDGDEWRRVFEEAAGIGVLHALLSGGEPLVRADIAEIVAHARGAGLYVNLITSGLGLTPRRAEDLRAAGRDGVQLSFQDAEAGPADRIAGASAHVVKLRAARLVRSLGLPLTANVVIHRRNIGRIGAIVAMAESLGASRLELANVQFHGWAFRNRAELLPDLDDVVLAERVVAEAGARLLGRMKILYVRPDYLGDRPKACMNGWGRRYLTVNPVGDVLPCPTSGEIPGLRFENVRRLSLRRIWDESEAFNRFRGVGWMPEPCRSCPLREVDHGGCRCQAALLTGDAAATDPACSLSPRRDALPRATRPTGPSATLVMRENPGRAPGPRGSRVP